MSRPHSAVSAIVHVLALAALPLVVTVPGRAAPAADSEAAPAAEWVERAFATVADLGLTGFLDARVGVRTRDDPYQEDQTLGELRLQLERQWEAGPAWMTVTGDLLYDGVADDLHLDLESGEGWLDLRQANALFTPFSFADLKVGRQIVTWGTGDLLFINDLFPKDWNAFFIGRDEEYLKAPSDAVRLSCFWPVANLDLVVTPRFDPNRFPDHRRLSSWNPVLQRRFGDDVNARYAMPDNWGNDAELALRVFRTVRGTELAVYAYDGFWKDPKGFDPGTGRATFPDLTVFGASARGTVAGGIGNVEVGYYDSRDDRGGDDRFVPNCQYRALVGYEREIARDLTAGVQYYVEFNLDHAAYRRVLPPGVPEADEHRHVITLRLTQLLMRQDLTLSLFAYCSPSDADAYLRPRVHYRLSDAIAVETGGNVFLGRDEHTFFGQFEKNTNVYASVRCSF